MFNIIITIFNIIVLLTLIYFLNKQRKNLISLEKQNIEIIDNDFEFKEILLLGIYNRFKEDNEEILKETDYDDDDTNIENPEKLTDIFKLKSPSDFEVFVAKIIKEYYGGSTYILGQSGSFGVSFEHDIEEGRFLGHVICTKYEIPFESIAIIHSNMIKDNVIGGYVISTSDFTSNAYKYANDLNIELINGEKLVDYWLAGLYKKASDIIEKEEN